MNRWFKYTLAIFNQRTGEVETTIFQGGPIEIVGGRFIQIEGTPNGTVLLNFDVVAQINYEGMSDE